MYIPKSTKAGILLGLTFLLCVGLAPAQQASIDNTSPVRHVALDFGENGYMNSGVRAAGSVSGRVFNSEEQAAELQGIGGVRVILRTVEAGFGSIVSNRISDAAGRYDFQDLRPGKYTIELERMSIPAKFRIPRASAPVNVEAFRRSIVDLSATIQRTITGIIFIDKDGDGIYKPGKDEPVKGAYVTVGGSLAVSNENGRYVLSDLPAGRIGLLVAWPNRSETTHVVLDLGTGPVTNRVVNIPQNR